MDTNGVKLGLLGGTGPEGRGLALRWARAGFQVIIGSRSYDRAEKTAADLNALLGDGVIQHGENGRVASQSEFVLLAVPFEHAASTMEAHQRDFQPGAIFIDSTVPVSFQQGKVRYAEPVEGSGSEHLRARLRPDVPLVAAFKTIPAHLLEEPDAPLDCDDFVASDSKEARERVMKAMRSIPGLRPVDAGLLESARTIERLTVLAIGINRRYKVKTARYRVIGL
ncbi:MAG TPA: NADPH-dependent F420 reductase [Blastocatellia bacterium]|nr:NADPH-dependent F420 reductase [Blastocatellia bacterium]